MTHYRPVFPGVRVWFRGQIADLVILLFFGLISVINVWIMLKAIVHTYMFPLHGMWLLVGALGTFCLCLVPFVGFVIFLNDAMFDFFVFIL